MSHLFFYRSGGERGADVETLRGTHGADFEGSAYIQRGEGGGIGCGCLGGGDEPKERLILIKGPFVFVFKNEDAAAPKYAVSLAHLKAKQQNPQSTVTIESNLGEVEYQIKFAEIEPAKQFVKVANKQAAIGESDEVRKRLGHQHLLNKRKSVRYAETVAMKKVDDQPEKPEHLSAEDIERFNQGI